jgi:peptidoglycan/xylan/chitin deacetylase (PgdA/CDA1 family)
MHHHIRIYNNPKDKIGDYLSIPPDKFKTELDLIEKLGYETVTFQDIVEHHIPPKPIMLTFDDGYEDFYQFAFPELQKRNMKAVIYLITSKLNTSDYMTTDQIKEMLPYHIEVGAHTVTHPNLTRLQERELTQEIEESKSFLEQLTGKPVISFCYPGGNYNPHVRSAVEKAGFLFATTTRRGDAYFEHPFDLARDRINFDTIIEGYFQGR